MLAAFALTCHAADGDMDAGFGTNGSIVLAPRLSPQALTVAIQDDGKIVVGGTRWAFGQDPAEPGCRLALPSDGTADPTFGDGGLSAIAIGQSAPFVFSVLPLPSGDILVAGNLGGFAVMRLHDDGALDAEFGNGDRVCRLQRSRVCGTAAIAVTVDPRDGFCSLEAASRQTALKTVLSSGLSRVSSPREPLTLILAYRAES
jgi:hypothetical protein